MLERPRALLPGGRIAVVAPAGPSDRARIEEAARKIEQRGYRVATVVTSQERVRSTSRLCSRSSRGSATRVGSDVNTHPLVERAMGFGG
jgi:hypothetical protein